MKPASILRVLEKQALFNTGTVKTMVRGKSQYSNLLLYRLKKAGHILEIERGKYTFHKNAFLIASRISWPSYITLWSALRYHNLTEQVPHAVWVVTTRKRRNTEINFAGTVIYFILTKQKYFFGYDKVKFEGFEIFIADPEKSIIDSLLFRKISVSEVYSILKNNMRTIKTKKLINYALRTGNKALIKRVSYMLDRLGVDHYKTVKRRIYYSYTPLEYNLPTKGRRVEKWKIVENVKL